MSNFIAYHNTERMKRGLLADGSLKLLTSKSPKGLLDATLWFVVGEGKVHKRFSLGGVIRVAEVGETEEEGFKRYASGPQHVFDPSIPLNDLPWFSDLIRVTGKFGLGVVKVSDESVINGFKQVALEAGYRIAE